MDICSKCDNILRSWSCDNRGRMIPQQSHARVVDLLSSASTCRLCDLIVSYPLTFIDVGWIQRQLDKNQSSVRDVLLDPSVPFSESEVVKFGVDLDKPARRSDPHKTVKTVEIEIPTECGSLPVLLAVWAVQGSPAALSARMCTTEAFVNDNSASMFDCIRVRINDCIKYHKKCKVTMSGNIINELSEPELPKRVLVFQSDSNSIQIKLLETRGLRGHYAALSYCWGPPGKHPPRTMKSNLKDNLNSISFDILPKTFQDAIHTAMAVGFQYIWIDSLCIVQDDGQDWLIESAIMGSIYEKASLTIAASAAEDPTKGCFRSIKPAQYVIEVPYYSSSSLVRGSFCTSAISQHNSSPYWGPLRERGWALQEWRLSRRIVHFTKGGVSWQCKEFRLCSRGFELDFFDYPKWDSLVQNYTECKLTVETDRLIALQGLVNEMQKATLDRYHSGVWESGLPEILLWMVVDVETPVHSLPTAPSWSWASLTGEKLFWSTQSSKHKLNHDKVAFCKLAAENPDIIKLNAPLEKCMISKHKFYGSRPCEFGDSPESDMRLLSRAPIHYIEGCGRQRRHLRGLAVLDKKDYDTAFHCCFLASSVRPKSDPVYRSFRQRRTPKRSFRIKTGSKEKRILQDLKFSEDLFSSTIECNSVGQSVHWVLLLQEVPHGPPGRFRRVGMGIVWSTCFVLKGISCADIELV